MTTHHESGDKPAKRSVEEALREAWMGALGAISGAESEWHRLRERLHAAAFGDESLLADLVAHVQKSRVELERRVDEGVKTAVARAVGPIIAEIDALRTRLDRLGARIEEQARTRTQRRRSGDTASDTTRATVAARVEGHDPAH